MMPGKLVLPPLNLAYLDAWLEAACKIHRSLCQRRRRSKHRGIYINHLAHSVVDEFMNKETNVSWTCGKGRRGPTVCTRNLWCGLRMRRLKGTITLDISQVQQSQTSVSRLSVLMALRQGFQWMCDWTEVGKTRNLADDFYHMALRRIFFL